ncbi:MAG: phosphatidylserine decarboxylase family protein [Rubrivivax sp.]|nr:MAG: phosphatidylserine decarboxylase family protein [Rubrivivax sp.]
MTLPSPFLARESWPVIGLTTLAAVLSSFFLGWGPVSAVLWLAVAALVHFVRHAPPTIPAEAGAILSPANGRVVKIEKVRDRYANRDALRISVFMNVFNATANRASVDGVVKQVQYFGKASKQQERSALVIESGGQIVTLVQVAGLIARRVLCYAKVGDILTRGQRYGLIRFGSRIDVYLPLHAVPQVATGQRVSATTTILATLPKA